MSTLKANVHGQASRGFHRCLKVKTTMVITSYEAVAGKLTELTELIATLEGEWKANSNLSEHVNTLQLSGHTVT